MTRVKKTASEKRHGAYMGKVRMLMGLPEFGEFIWDVLDMADLYGISFTGNSKTFYNEGRREVGLDIVGLLNEADPTFFPRMLLDKAKQDIITRRTEEKEDGSE